jgi:hypothetical protein
MWPIRRKQCVQGTTLNREFDNPFVINVVKMIRRPVATTVAQGGKEDQNPGIKPRN